MDPTAALDVSEKSVAYAKNRNQDGPTRILVTILTELTRLPLKIYELLNSKLKLLKLFF